LSEADKGILKACEDRNASRDKYDGITQCLEQKNRKCSTVRAYRTFMGHRVCRSRRLSEANKGIPKAHVDKKGRKYSLTFIGHVDHGGCYGSKIY